MRKLGSEEKHLKINNSHFDILGWNWGEHYDKLSASTTLSIIGELEKNEWNGKQKVQVRLVDMLV